MREICGAAYQDYGIWKCPYDVCPYLHITTGPDDDYDPEINNPDCPVT
jgi:hypothetical protein